MYSKFKREATIQRKAKSKYCIPSFWPAPMETKLVSQQRFCVRESNRKFLDSVSLLFFFHGMKMAILPLTLLSLNPLIALVSNIIFRMANSSVWNDIDDDDDFIDDNFSFRQFRVALHLWLSDCWKIVVSHPRIPIIALVCLAALLAINIVTISAFANQYTNDKISKAEDFALDTGNWFRQQLTQATFPLFALSESVKEMSIFWKLPSLIGPGGETGSAPYVNATIINHRNVSDICDNATMLAEFNRIAKIIKNDANLGGSLVALELLPASVVCTAYPLNNTEDFAPPLFLDNSGAVGLDLLKDPRSRALAVATLGSSKVVVAGPLQLTQCPDCPPVVKTAFIARLSVNMPPELGYNITVDGSSYSSWGLVSAIISWERILGRSDIFQRFESRGMQFELSKTDRNFNTTTNQYDEKTSVLAKSARANSIGANNFYNLSLPTTNNNWTIAVAYDDGAEAPWLGWAMALSIILSIILSIVLLVLLIKKQKYKNLVREMIPSKAIKKLQRNQVVVDKYEMVTVFQSDIIGFTSMSAEMTPIRVMRMLNSYFEGLDKLANKHNVYKIKTIGDAYICVAGCPVVCSGRDGAERIALFALDMMEYTRNFRTEEGTEIRIRAGIHSGRIVAGVVGHLRPQYTIFGNTVSIAASMEASSEAMKTQCSNATWRLLRDNPKYLFSFLEGRRESEKEKIHETWFLGRAAAKRCLSEALSTSRFRIINAKALKEEG
mmetsp:Transcript_7337/g.10664  ORF Transcript_7337/g.10664 Transcript_7337/m.10664 type:complete len:724 (+) Transcript_7337:171-2342(+)